MMPFWSGIEAMSSSNPSRLITWLKNPGTLCSLPATIYLCISFIGPLIMVLAFSFIPSKTFSLFQAPTLENYRSIVENSYYLSFVWSGVLALAAVSILFVVCYPVAYGMAKLFGPWANLVTILIAIPILVSENIRLFGWVLVLIKNGVLDGMLMYLFGMNGPEFLYTIPAILFGMCYVYLPFMLFPLVMGITMVPDQLKEAASDMGASRLQVFTEIELPMSLPGILIGCILTFILTLGSLVESKILGGQSLITIADDIESAFTFAQDWPKGSALSVLLISLSAVIVLTLFRYVDLDRIIGRR